MTDAQVLCIHGRLSPDIETQDQILINKYNVEIPDKSAFCDLGLPHPRDIATGAMSPCGIGCLLGSQVTHETAVNSQSQVSSTVESFLYLLVDQFVIFFIVSPCAVLFWRGSWKIFDEFLFPKQLHISAWVSVSIGCSFTILMIIFVECKNEEWRLSEKYAGWNMFMYPMSVAVVHSWRGYWLLLDHYIPTNGVSLLSSHLGSFSILSITKTISNSLFTPAIFTSDLAVTPFQIHTAFGMSTAKILPFYKVLDYGFSMSVVTVSNVAFWRSLWYVMDIYWFPSHPALSNLVSLALGYVVIIFCKLAESFLKSLAAKSSKAVVFMIQVVFSYSMGFAAIGFWRGAWQLVDIFVFPDYPVIVGFACHGLGILILYLTRSVINAIGCPCETRVDSLEMLTIFNTTVGTVVSHPRGSEENERSHKEMKQLFVVNTSSDLEMGTKSDS